MPHNQNSILASLSLPHLKSTLCRLCWQIKEFWSAHVFSPSSHQLLQSFPFSLSLSLCLFWLQWVWWVVVVYIWLVGWWVNWLVGLLVRCAMRACVRACTCACVVRALCVRVFMLVWSIIRKRFHQFKSFIILIIFQPSYPAVSSSFLVAPQFNVFWALQKNPCINYTIKLK